MTSISFDPALTLGTGAHWAPSVRPVTPVRPIEKQPWPASEPSRSEEAGGPIRSTAYQRNADGDEASFSSKLDELTKEEQEQVEKLKKRDQEVRTHEQAHLSAAGALARGGASYTYQRGPDSKRYAVGGSVQIDTSPGKTPEETIAKAQQIRRAALAPAEPSSTDRAVAAKAAQMETKARAELAKQRSEGEDSETKGGAGPSATSPASDMGQSAAPSSTRLGPIDTYA
jgi:hypothetical protein